MMIELTSRQIRKHDTRLGPVESCDFIAAVTDNCPKHTLFSVKGRMYVRGPKEARMAVVYFYEGWLARDEDYT